jgi:phage FluMu gp28-like protein
VSNANAPSPYDLLLPYQREWVADSSRFKIWLKSRQIGGSLAASFEVVADAIATGSDWIILSAGERQALEFMEKVHRVARIFAQAVEHETGQPFIPETKASQIRFPNGARILALPANASTARGYSANLVLDEFAFHENPEEIWRAVYPIITNPLRGKLKLRVISTPAGMNNKFYELWNEAPDFKRHKTSVYDAVEQGLRLNIDELKANLADPDGWAQEFECQFMEHAAQVFPMSLIRSVEDPAASFGPYETRTPNPLFVGIDIGRRKDLTVAWTLERVASTYITREITVLDNIPFPEQEAILADRVASARYVAIDATGIGGPVSEHLAKRLGDYKLEAVNFTNDRKRELFSRAKKAFQSQKVEDPTQRQNSATISPASSASSHRRAWSSSSPHAPETATPIGRRLWPWRSMLLRSSRRVWGLSQNSPALVGANIRAHRPMRTRFAQAWR